MKYKWRKKYTKEEAESQIENILQSYSIQKECINYWILCPRTKSDVLIEALCWETREEMIKNGMEKLEYMDSKLEYLYKFSPGYRPKLSF